MDPKDPKTNNIEIYENQQKVVIHQQEEKAEKEVGLFIKALQLVGAGFKFNFDQHSLNSILSNIETLDVEFIVPTDGYVLKSMEKAQVQAWIKRRWPLPNRNVYMITALKIARPTDDGGTAIQVERESGQNASGEFKASGKPAGEALGAGGLGKVSEAKKNSLSFVPTKPFIYAFEVHSCYYGSGPSAKSQLHTSGALLHSGDAKSEVPKEDGISSGSEPQKDLEFVFHGVGDEPLDLTELGTDAKTFDLHATIDEVTGVECTCLV